MRPGVAVSADDPYERFLSAWSLPLAGLDRSTPVEVDRLLGIGDRGGQLFPASSGRFGKVARSGIRRAVDQSMGDLFRRRFRL